MLDQNQLNDVTGSTVYDAEGNKIGKVGQVYTDDETDQPTWATVNTGLFGTSESFVPIREVTFTGGEVTVPYSKDQVKDAPNVDSDEHLTPADERRLYQHYGLDYEDGSGTGEPGRSAPAPDEDAAAPAVSSADDTMTRSEERIEVGTQTRESGRARLRKYVVTENVTQTVPVRKEKVVVEREPITDANIGDAAVGAEIGEGELEIVLHEEVPVVQKSVEAVERVRLGTEEVQGEETVTEEVRKEQIEAEGDITNQ